MRLTDQALLAYHLAGDEAAARDDSADVIDLLAGLAAEPDGLAGGPLRATRAVLTILGDRRRASPAGLASAEVAVAWAADDLDHARPVATLELLRACLEVGGSSLARYLEHLGAEELTRLPAALEADPLAETFGLDPSDPELSVVAARAVARARAAGGSGVDLVCALAREARAGAPVPVPDDIDERLALLRRHGPGADPRGTWDAGVEAVVDAARAGHLQPERLSPTDLLRAAATVGGRAPRALLAPAE